MNEWIEMTPGISKTCKVKRSDWVERDERRTANGEERKRTNTDGSSWRWPQKGAMTALLLSNFGFARLSEINFPSCTASTNSEVRRVNMQQLRPLGRADTCYTLLSISWRDDDRDY